MHRVVCCLVVASVVCGCSGVKHYGDQVTVHAESLNLLGFEIPSNSEERARKLVPPGTEIHTAASNPTDWTSVLGIFNRIIGIGWTQISGKKS
jgi:hypothetical protein